VPSALSSLNNVLMDSSMASNAEIQMMPGPMSWRIFGFEVVAIGKMVAIMMANSKAFSRLVRWRNCRRNSRFNKRRLVLIPLDWVNMRVTPVFSMMAFLRGCVS